MCWLGLIALASLPREEQPQISVPLVDVHVRADGLRAADAVKLVTEPLESIIKGIDDVEQVYSDTRDDQAMVTARFEVACPRIPRSCGCATRYWPKSAGSRLAYPNRWWSVAASTTFRSYR
ncbi:efflux RND transporter permease subunit [Ruegeria marisrubri]|uniref:efflux RND transporter permease subunit n=1 Tax=Ruegeria marisrubri TaxID=1685379 RepID=UPI0039905138